MCVSTERETLALERILTTLTPKQVDNKLKHGEKLLDIERDLRDAPLAPPPPGL